MSPEKVPGGSTIVRAILDLGLGGEVFGRLDGRNHPLDGEKSRQVGGVGGDHDEGEEPPEAGHEAS